MAGAERRSDSSGWRFLALLCLTGTACSRGVRPPCDYPPPFYVTVRASDRLNPDAQGESLTTVVRILQLKGITRLENLDFTEVWQRGKEALGEDFLQLNETSIDPGANMTLGFPRESKAAYAVIMPIFRVPSGTSWRSIVRLPDVPTDDCSAQPPPVKSQPSPRDAQFHFVVEDFRIESGNPDGGTRAQNRAEQGRGS